MGHRTSLCQELLSSSILPVQVSLDPVPFLLCLAWSWWKTHVYAMNMVTGKSRTHWKGRDLICLHLRGDCCYCCCCPVTKLCPTLHDPMDCSTPGFPVPHHLPEFAQVHVHWISDAIQPSHLWSTLFCCLQSLPESESFPMSQLLLLSQVFFFFSYLSLPCLQSPNSQKFREEFGVLQTELG